MIFALHYFLWYSALTPIYGYLSVYASDYSHVSPQTFGILNMWLPFMSMVAKPLFCSLADHYQAYRTFFIMFLGLALFGWGSFGVLPFFIEIPKQNDGLNVLNWILICLMTFAANLSMSVICCLSDAFAVNQAKKTKTSYGKIRVWGTIGWGISSVAVAFLNDIHQLPILVPGLLLTIFSLVLDLTVVVLWRDRSSFELDKPIADIDDGDDDQGQQPPMTVVRHNSMVDNCHNRLSTTTVNTTNSSSQVTNRTDITDIDISLKDVNSFSDGHNICHHIQATTQCPNTIENLLRNEAAPQDPYCTKVSVVSPCDTATSQTITSIYGTINSYVDDKNKSANASGQQMAATHQAKKKQVITLRLQLLMLYMVINARPSLIRFMILFTLSGLLMSMQWVYFFLYLEQIYKTDFTYISSLSMVGQSLLGELPFFIISQKIIDLIGRSNALSFSIAAIAIRYLLYIYLLPYVSMYFVVLVEALQGPSFGLFYVVMTDIGMDYSNCDDVIVKLVDSNHIENNAQDIQTSRRALRATMQGLVSACFEGLGQGLGSVIGGYVIQHQGWDQLWVGSALLALSGALVNFIIDINNR